MIIYGDEIDPNSACTCSDKFTGDSIYVEDNSFKDLLNGVNGCGIDISGYLKNISFIEKRSYTIPTRHAMKLGKDANNPQDYKFLLVSFPNDKDLYWNHIDPFLSGSINFDYTINLRFESLLNNMIQADGVMELIPDNSIRNTSWANIANVNINGDYYVNWVDATRPWNEVSPLILTNQFIKEKIVLGINSFVNQDDDGNISGRILAQTIQDGIIVKLSIEISGFHDPDDSNNTVINIDSLEVELDGKYVATFSESITIMQTADDIAIDVDLSGTLVTTNATRYRKAHGILLLSSDSVEALDDILLFNPNITDVNIQVMMAG